MSPQSEREIVRQHPHSRREFLTVAGSCSAHLALFASLPAGIRPPIPGSRTTGSHGRFREPWADIERISDGMWAVISKPLEDRTTLCNGGIIAGRQRVAVVESFASNRGAAWVGERSRELTGRWPTDVIITHYHGDHANGLAGFLEGGRPSFWMTAATRDRISDQNPQREDPEQRAAILANANVLPQTGPHPLELGGVRIQIVGRYGHTSSDVSVEIEDPSVVMCGDLVWNRMFPNYMDAIPTQLGRDVRDLVRERETVYVPGHGPLADHTDLRQYIGVLDAVEEAARRAYGAGTPMPAAATEFELPQSLGEWYRFSPRYYEVAFEAWGRDLDREDE